MEEGRLQDLETLFAQVEDLGVERNKLHRLRDRILPWFEKVPNAEIY